MTTYPEIVALAEGARQSDVDRAQGRFRRVEDAYHAKRTAAGRADLQTFYEEAERTRDAAIKDATLRHHNRLAVAAAALGVTRDRAPGDASDPEALAWCAERGIAGLTPAAGFVA